MNEYKYYEVEGAVFRDPPDCKMEIYNSETKEWKPYTGDRFRVTRQSNPMTLAEINADLGYDLKDENPVS